MKNSRLKKLIAIAAALSLLAGCGSSAGSASGTSPVSSAASEAAESSAESGSDAVIANIVGNTDPRVISNADPDTVGGNSSSASDSASSKAGSTSSKPESAASGPPGSASAESGSSSKSRPASGSADSDEDSEDSDTNSVVSMPDYATTPADGSSSGSESASATAASASTASSGSSGTASSAAGKAADNDSSSSANSSTGTNSTTSSAESSASESSSSTAEQPELPGDNTNDLRVREILRNYKQDTDAMTMDSSAWLYDEGTDIYYQLSVPYCANPSSDIEVLGIYVPAAYMDAQPNGDGTFTCAVRGDSEVNGYTAATAPFIFPIHSLKFEAQEPQDEFNPDGISAYTGNGYICVLAGLRGSANDLDRQSGNVVCGGAPWAVADLKAAIRFCRLNADVLPGDMNAVFTTGSEAGGLISEVAGASGDSPLYYTYLTQIGAAMYDKDGSYISDTICGAAAFDSAASPDSADAAYEWESGQYASDASRAEDVWTGTLSDDLAASYADYVNGLALTDESGSSLTIERNDDGSYSGSYISYLMDVLGQSAAPGSSGEDAADFISSIDPAGDFLTWNSEEGTASVTDLAKFFTSLRPADLACPAFDTANADSAMNDLFGTSESDFRHFDGTISNLLTEHATTYSGLEGWDSSLTDTYANDLAAADEVGSDTRTRVDMMSPLYFVNKNEGGAGTSNIAPYFLMDEYVNDTETTLTQGVNLQLSLSSAGSTPFLTFLWIDTEGIDTETDVAQSETIGWIDILLK